MIYEEDGDPFKSEGHLQLKIEKLSEFSQDIEITDPVHVLGLPWQILARIELGNVEGQARKSFSYSLLCKYDGTGDSSWACATSVTFTLLAQKEDKRDKFEELDHIFTAKEDEELKNSIPLEELMDPENGWYDVANDSIALTVDFKADALRGISHMHRPDILFVNGEEVRVNKYNLACNSIYFERFFYGHEYKKNNTIVLVPPTTVDHFKRMIDAMHPDNCFLDDECIEGVCQLANQYFLGVVENRCERFLWKESELSIFTQFLLADKYGFEMLKAVLSKELAKFYRAKDDRAKMSESARRELDAHFGFEESMELDGLEED